MDIIEKAMELGQGIAGSNEMKRLKESDISLQSSSTAMMLMQEYKELQLELVRASKAKSDTETLEGIREKLLMKQQELYQNEITNEYLEAKSAFDGLMKKINDVISYAITGEEPCSSSKCGSCGGCK